MVNGAIHQKKIPFVSCVILVILQRGHQDPLKGDEDEGGGDEDEGWEEAFVRANSVVEILDVMGNEVVLPTPLQCPVSSVKWAFL